MAWSSAFRLLPSVIEAWPPQGRQRDTFGHSPMPSDEGGDGGASKHLFWGTQPVPQSDIRNVDQSNGPIDAEKAVKDVRQEPYTIPEQFEWCSCDMKDATVVDEVFSLLSNNYVEDSEATFRFEYTRDFLKWALMPKGFFSDWHVGVRVSAS